MLVGSGLAGSFTVTPETAYATTGTGTVGYEVASVGLKRNKRTTQGGGLSGGNIVDRGVRRTQPIQDANGPVAFEVTNHRFGNLLQYVTGTAANATITNGTGYSQTYPLTDDFGKSFTAQVGVPDLTGTVRPYTYLGCKVADADFSCAMGGLLMATLTLDAKQVTETPSYITPTYTASSLPFHFGQMSIFIGAAGSITPATPVSGVKSASVKIARPHNVDRFYAGAAGLKAEPIMNGKVAVTGSLSVDFIDKTVFVDKFATDTPFSLQLSWVGGTIAGSTSQDTFTATLSNVFLDTDTPTLTGPDVVNTTINYTALFDGTNPAVSFSYISSDATA